MVYRRLLAVLFCWVLALDTRAQTATVKGYVSDATNEQPLEFVNVVVLRDGQLVDGATTDLDGLYLVARLAPGRYELRATYIGYETFSTPLDLAPNETRTINVALRPDAATLGEVVVQSERQSGAARVTAGQQMIRPADVELVPAPDVSADLVNYLTTLPGVVSTGDRGGQLFIRGGEPSQTLVLLDGIEVYQPFHILGFYSAFPSDVLNRADLYAGGFGARFGERISTVIDIASRNGDKRRFGGAASLSPFISALRLEGPVLPGRVSFLASARQSTIEHGAARYLDRPLPFDFNDLFAKLHADVSARGRLSVTGLSTHDRGTLAEAAQPGGADEIQWENQGVGLRYVHLPNVLPIATELRLTHSRLHTELGPRGAPARTSTISNTALSVEASFTRSRVSTDAGISLNFVSSRSSLGGLFQNVETDATQVDHFALYVEPEFRFGTLRVRTGARMQWYAVRIDPYVEPRLRVIWTLGRHELSGAAGLYHQEIVGLNDRRDAASVFTAWTNVPSADASQPGVLAGRVPQAVHGLLGYRTQPVDGLELSVEGYYKQLDNLYIPEWTAYPQLSTRLQPAAGRTFGFDVRAEVRREPFYAAVTYGLSSTRYEARQASLAVWYGEEALRFRAPHDRRHQVNALFSTKVRGFDLSARWEFGSGLPYSRPIGFDGFVLVDRVIDPTRVPYTRRVIYERPYNALLPTYHRLDLSVERTFTAGPARVTMLGSVINAYDRRNLFYLDVFTLRRADQLPIVPSAGLKVAFE